MCGRCGSVDSTGLPERVCDPETAQLLLALHPRRSESNTELIRIKPSYTASAERAVETLPPRPQRSGKARRISGTTPGGTAKRPPPRSSSGSAIWGRKPTPRSWREQKPWASPSAAFDGRSKRRRQVP